MDIPTTLSIARIRGTAVRLHLLSILAIGWYVLADAAGGTGSFVQLGGVVGALLVHELGHHIAARLLGVRVERTDLLPFGGLPLLCGNLPLSSEAAYRLAGPLANLFALLLIAAIHDSFVVMDETLVHIMRQFSLGNTLVGVVNLLPLYPLDGGAIVEAAHRRSSRSFTHPWSRIVVPLSIVGLLALGWACADPVPVAAAIGVVLSAVHRVARERTEAIIGDLTVGSIMTPVSELPALAHGATIDETIPTVVRSIDSLFVVSHNLTPLGFVFRKDIIDVASGGESRYLAQMIVRGLSTVDEATPLEEILERSGDELTDPLVVSRGDEIRGLLFREQILEFMLVRNGAWNGDRASSSDRTW